MVKPRISTIFLALVAFGGGVFGGSAAMIALLYRMSLNHTVQHLLHSEATKVAGTGPAAKARGALSNPVFLNWQPVKSKRSTNWLVRRGLDVELVAEGFNHPVSLAARSKTPARPYEPWLYLAEEGGQIRTLAADGTLGEFTENLFASDADTNAKPARLVSLAVDSASRDLFASALVSQGEGKLVDQVLRLEANADGDALRSTKVLAEFHSDVSTTRRIGPLLQKADGSLLVAFGDGGSAGRTVGMEHPDGKILALDGHELKKWDSASERPEVVATGFRNVTGLGLHPTLGLVVAIESGESVDRLCEVKPGMTFGWNESGDSLRCNAVYSWGPQHSIAPAALLFLDRPALGEGTSLRGLIAAEGGSGGGSPALSPTIVEFSLDPMTGMITGMPEPIAELAADVPIRIAGLAAGASGVYLATYEPGEPKSSGRLWRIFPSKETLDLPDANAEALAKMAPEERGAVYFSQNCSSCHRVAGVGGTEGPDLTHASKELNKRLNGASYESMIKNMMASDDPYKTSQRPRFESVLKQKGKARLKAWLTNHLEEPRFDHPFAKMPSFSATLTPEKREDIMSYVISRE